MTRRFFACGKAQFKSKMRIEYCKYFIIVETANAKYILSRGIWLIFSLTLRCSAFYWGGSEGFVTKYFIGETFIQSQ